MIQYPKTLSELFINYVKNKPYYSVTTSNLKLIEEGALDFLTDNCGVLYSKITDDYNLNVQIVNVMAQTFISHFWNNRIGYDSSDSFFIKLSAFFNENLPIWAQYFRELIINNGGMYTEAGSVTVTNNGNLHYEGNSDTNTDTKSNSNTNTNTKATTNSTNDGTSTTSTDTKSNGNTTNNSNNTEQFTDAGSLHVDTTTPQNTIDLKPDYIKSGEYYKAYDYQYADNVNVDFSNQKITNTGGNITDNTSSSHTDSSTTTHNEGNVTTNSTTDSTTNGSTNSQSNAKDNHTQQTSDNSQTVTKLRHETLSRVANALSRVTNGAYLSLFYKAKKSQLFLLVY